MNPVDPRLYLILGTADCHDREPAAVAQQAAEGGVTLVQLREKSASTQDFLSTAQAVLGVLQLYRIPLLINDRIDIALAAGADGVHIGQDDMPVADARRLLGAQAIIGLTVRSLAEAEQAPLQLLDYISIGGVFVTHSKDNTETPIGLDGLRRIAAYLRQRSALPQTAIAGIHADNAAAVIAAGVDGLAVISALCAAPEPRAAAQALRHTIDTALASRVSS